MRAQVDNADEGALSELGSQREMQPDAADPGAGLRRPVHHVAGPQSRAAAKVNTPSSKLGRRLNDIGPTIGPGRGLDQTTATSRLNVHSFGQKYSRVSSSLDCILVSEAMSQ